MTFQPSPGACTSAVENSKRLLTPKLFPIWPSQCLVQSRKRAILFCACSSRLQVTRECANSGSAVGERRVTVLIRLTVSVYKIMEEEKFLIFRAPSAMHEPNMPSDAECRTGWTGRMD